jgi:hypothetical protein
MNTISELTQTIYDMRVGKYVVDLNLLFRLSSNADADTQKYIYEINQRQLEVCRWTLDEDDCDGEQWNSSCGETWCFLAGTPKENNMNFCPVCGKLLKETT